MRSTPSIAGNPVPRALRSACRAVSLVALAALASPAAGDEPCQLPGGSVGRVAGPATAQAAGGLVRIDLGEGFALLENEAARRWLEACGNPSDGGELAVVVPEALPERWFMVVRLRPGTEGPADASALLASSRALTEETNGWRSGRGLPGLHVERWVEEPRWDADGRRLTWALLARDDRGRTFANVNVRVATPAGLVSVTLVGAGGAEVAALPGVRRAMGGVSVATGTALPGGGAVGWTQGGDASGRVAHR